MLSGYQCNTTTYYTQTDDRAAAASEARLNVVVTDRNGGRVETLLGESFSRTGAKTVTER